MSRTSSTSDRTIASLTAEVDKWKLADAAKAERLAVTIREVEKLQHDLSTSATYVTQLRSRCEAQSHEIMSMRNEFQVRMSLSDEKDRTVTLLTAEIEKWKHTDALKEEHIVTFRKETETLQRELASTSSHITELRQRYEVQSRELSSLRVELQDKASGKDRHVSSLLSQVEEWKRLDATKGDELRTVHKDLDQLRRDLATSSSQIESWKRSDATKAMELTVAQKEIEQWKRSDTDKAEELATERKKLEQLQTQTECYTRDLKSQLDGVHRFVATADTYAVTTIIQTLQKLNAEVQQNTALMAECMLEGFGPRATKPTKEQSSAAQRVSESIGKTLTGCLGIKERDDDLALYLSIAFQAYLTYHLHSVISSWTIKKDCDEFINEIYKRLQKSGKKLNFECHQISADSRKIGNRGANDIGALAIPHAHLHLSPLYQRPGRSYFSHCCRAL